MSQDALPMTTDHVGTDEPWWKSAVIYQIYPRSFADSDGDGVGDLRGIIDHLDHLQYLGVDAVWLSPIYPSPGDDNGYDISDYQDIDPALGTLADFDELLADVHRRGMKLILDLVVNHTSDEHPWFAASRSHCADPQRDWYIWRPARTGTVPGTPGAEPSNWSSFFSGSTWEFDEASGEYYLHLFSRKQPDLNWENPVVRSAVYAMMNWWLDRGVDGFRMDVINLLSKDPEFPDGAVGPSSPLGDGFPHYGDGPRIHEYLQQMREQVFARRPGQFLTVGETPGATLEHARRYTDAARRELDMIFHFEHVSIDHGPSGKFDPIPFQVSQLREVFDRWQTGLAQKGWNALYWNNHDQPRVVSRFGDPEQYWRESATALAAVLHLQRGTPYIYQGEEIGMTNMPVRSPAELRDIESLRYYKDATTNQGIEPLIVMTALTKTGRDNARTPMQWAPQTGAGFTTGTPSIEVNPNHSFISVDAQTGAADSVLEKYRQLIALRHRVPVVAFGNFTMIPTNSPNVIAFRRQHQRTELLTVANLSGDPAEVDLHEWEQAEVVFANYPPATATEPNRHSRLQPWEAPAVIRAV